MEEDSGEVVASNTSVQTTTVSSMSTPSAQHTQPGHTDRHTVQVIQQAVHRPAGVAQYLQQMYAAQQHHIMLQTLHQHHQPTCPAAHTSVGSTHQSNSQQTTSSPSSANGSSAVPLPSSSLSQLQSPTVSASTGTISQQAVLLGNGSAPGSQAQMYLRTQMLILAPAATVAADLPALCSASSQPLSTQVPSLALRTHLPGALSAAHGIQLKSTQGQTLVTPLPRMSICPLKSTQLSQALTETSRRASPALVRHQMNCPPSPKGATPQFILQSGVAQRQGQPFALRVTSQDSSHPPLSLLSQTTPTSTAVLSHHCEVVSSHTPCDHLANQKTEQQQSVVASTSMLPALPDPPPLHLAPVVDPLCHPQPLSFPPPPPPLTLAPPRLSAAAPPPPSVQRLSLRSVHALAVQSDHMLLSEDELPVAETLAQLPYQNLPPPQTAAVDLKVQPNAHMDAALAQSLQEDRLDVLRHEVQKCPDRSRTPSPPALTPTVEKHNSCRDVTQHNAQTVPSELSCLQSSRSVIQLAEGAALQPAARSSSSSSPPASQQPQQASNRPHILTHLIEGFVFTEGLEPFPASLKKSQQAQLPKTQELPENREPAQSDLLLDTEQPENSSDSNMDNTAAEDERSEMSPLNLLQCEFCGKKSYTHTFHRSKRFCSMTCIRSFNVSSTDPAAVLRAHRVNRWSSRPIGRRGRPPGRMNRTQREHFYRQVTERNNLHSYRVITPQVSVSSPRVGEKKCEDAPSPRTTRLHGQVERYGEREQEEREREDCSSSSTGLLDCSPALWSVEQVCSYISSLPGCQDMVAEFRSQEIDGQALLLLTEEHLMSAMNIKLGPALKICSQINSLKRH
uniref:Polyhomeotic homolog 3 n=1 Tax=Astyanax mexicanus TaxID=7994 RepID=W5KFX6_ASTMX